METVTFTKVVDIADADGKPIAEGSVLREIIGRARGVVVRVSRIGDRPSSMLDSVGDVHIRISPGSMRVTNCYSKWRHIPHNDQTYQERLLAWIQKPHHHDPEYDRMSSDMALCVSGIMALLPDDVVDWERGPWPDSIEDALGFLVSHLSNNRGEP